MERAPEFRIVGNTTEEEKEEVKEELHEALAEDTLAGLSEEMREKVHRLEYEKYEDFYKVIDFANLKTNQMLEDLGLPPTDFPAKNIHVLPSDLYEELRGGDTRGFADSESQAIFLNVKYSRDSRTNVALTIFHEMLHLKGHFSMEVNDKPDGQQKSSPYRVGTMVKALQKDTDEERYYRYFVGLNEAIVSSQEKKFIESLQENEVFAEELEHMGSKGILELKAEQAEKKGVPEDEIQWINEDKSKVSFFAYREYRSVYAYVLKEIHAQFPDKFETVDDVNKEFLKAHFTGHLVGIGRLVEKTFGKGAFRVFGTMRTEEEGVEYSAEDVRGKLEGMRKGVKEGK
jgi:hypothetical protein